MHRIDSVGATTANRFTEGDATQDPPIHATVIADDWLNTLQEEVAYCIEVQGTTLLTKTETVAQMKQLHDAVGQSWVTWVYAGASSITELEGRNASVAWSATGIYNVTWDTDFADTNYCVTATAGFTDSSVKALICTVTDIAVGSCTVRVNDDTGTDTHDSAMRVSIRATGTQA